VLNSSSRPQRSGAPTIHRKTLFSNGAIEEMDLSGELHGEVFEPLKDLASFKQVRVNEETNTIEWPNGVDFAPEFLDQIGKGVKRVA
jgi:hypothetical protein